MAPQVGLVSGRLEEKEYGFKPGSRVYAGPDWGWQTQESYQKTIKMRRGGAFFDWMATTIGDPIKAAISPVVQAVAPVVQPVAEAVSGIIQSTPVVGPLSQAVSTTTETLRKEATQRGIDPRVADVAMMAGEELVGGVVSKTLGMASKVINNLPGPPAPGLATAGGAPMPTPMRLQADKGGIVLKATTSPEWTSPKAGSGSAVSEQFAPAVETYQRRRKIYSEVKDDLKAAYESGKINAERLKKALIKIGKHEKGVMSTFPYDETNPEAYLTDLRVAQPYRQERAGQRGVLGELEGRFGRVDPYDVTKQAQQHHVLAKAETKPFADTLLNLIDKGIGDDDDLVNFFVWSEKYDLYPGNVVKNLLDMGEITHTTAKQDPMALHKILDMAGLEFGSQTKPQIIKRYGLDKVKSVDELMQAYDRYLQEIAVPSRDIAYKVQDWWYNKTIKTLKGKELAEFKANFAKLQDPRRSP